MLTREALVQLSAIPGVRTSARSRGWHAAVVRDQRVFRGVHSRGVSVIQLQSGVLSFIRVAALQVVLEFTPVFTSAE